jgi:hypothetical protein
MALKVKPRVLVSEKFVSPHTVVNFGCLVLARLGSPQLELGDLI